MRKKKKHLRRYKKWLTVINYYKILIFTLNITVVCGFEFSNANERRMGESINIDKNFFLKVVDRSKVFTINKNVVNIVGVYVLNAQLFVGTLFLSTDYLTQRNTCLLIY